MDIPGVGGATCGCGLLSAHDVTGYHGINVTMECPYCHDVLTVLPARVLPTNGDE